MPNVFDKLPRAFFRPLAAPGAPVYLGILLNAYQETQKTNGLVPRETLMGHALTWLDRPEWQEAVNQVEAEVPGYGVTKDEWNNATEREGQQARAAGMLRYLETTGWLRSEVQTDYSLQYLIPDYAFRILIALHEVAHSSTASLQGSVCAIHDLLQAAVRDGSIHVRLLEAHRQTQTLMNSLRELHHNIGQHLERVLASSDPNEILKALFSSYRAEVMDRAYHQLKTTDHISRFRPAIIEALDRIGTPELIDSASKAWLLNDPRTSEEASRQELAGALHFIADNMSRMDDLLHSIDLRHGQFVDAAVRAVERRMRETTSTSAALGHVLETLLNPKANGPGLSNEAAPSVSNIIDLVSFGVIDSRSLYTAPQLRERFAQEKPAALSKPSNAAIAASRQAIVEQLMRVVSPDRVRSFVDGLFLDKNPCLASTLPLRGVEDLALLMYLRAYGDGRYGYVAKDIEPVKWVVSADLGFNDFLLEAFHV